MWTHSATKSLIAAVVENRDTYENDTTRHTTFFRDISKVLAEKKHFYNAGQCERKMQQLKKLYKDERQRLLQTGAPGNCNFPYYEDLHELMEGRASVDPPITVAVGVGPLVVNHAAAGGQAAAAPALNEGMGRHATIRRPRALNERRVKAIEDIASALQKKYSL